MAAPCRTKVAEQLLEIGAKAGIAGLAGAALKDVADKMTADELDHLVTLEMMGNDELTGKYLSSLQDKYGSESASTPNVGKDLTDSEKVEIGGVGSGTGTPPPPENEPNQQNDKPVQKLNQKQESSIRKIDNLIKNSIKDHDITGTLKDMDSNPIIKTDGSGKYWNHMKEMQDTLNGLRNHANTLKNVNNPEAQAAYGRATDAINKLESAIKGYGIWDMTTFRDLLLINNRNYELSNDSPLDQWFSGVVDIPIDQLDVGDIARSIRQDVFLADVLPRAEALLKEDPLAGDDYDGQLISSIASLNRDEIKEALPCFLKIASYLSQLNKNDFDRQMIMDIEKIIKLSQV